MPAWPDLFSGSTIHWDCKRSEDAGDDERLVDSATPVRVRGAVFGSAESPVRNPQVPSESFAGSIAGAPFWPGPA
jgi:hypothetical protein